MLTFDGLRLHVRTYGPQDAPLTVVLAHCWTLNHRDWHYQVEALQREFGHNIQILTWDHRGHGESEHSRTAACTIANLARDMVDVVAEYAPHGKLVVAGHSIGGMAMMAVAEQNPQFYDRVVGAAFISTSSGRLNTITLGLPEVAGKVVRGRIPRLLWLRTKTLTRRARRRAPIFERQVVSRFVFGEPVRLTDITLTVEGIIGSPSATLVGFYNDCMVHERTEYLKVFDGIPTQVLVGTQDVLTPPSHSRRIAENIEDAVLTVVPKAGHMLTLERDELVSGTLIRLVRPHVSDA